MTLRLYISTGETSGTEHAARLVRACRAMLPEDDLRLTGMGGALLRAAGVETVADLSGRGIMGFAEVLGHIPAIRRTETCVRAHLAETRPDVVVLVDYPGFHLRLARWIRAHLPATRIVYYIAPKAWAWKENRVRALRACVDRLLVIFPFEEAWFGERGLPATYVGNPTLDVVREVPKRTEARTRLDLPESAPILALLPGSRRAEVKRMLPVFLETAARLRNDRPRLRVALGLAPGLAEEEPIFAAARSAGVRFVTGESRCLMRGADLVLAKSGTVTLEAALLGTPLVVAYRGGALSAWIARHVVRLSHFSLPNILAGRTIVPEFFQEAVTADALSAAAGPLLADSDAARAMRHSFAELRRELGEDTVAARRAAEIVLATARETRRGADRDNRPPFG